MSRIPSLALLLLTAITLFQQPAVADTYQTLLLNSDAEVFLYGIDDNEVVLENPDLVEQLSLGRGIVEY